MKLWLRMTLFTLTLASIGVGVGFALNAQSRCCSETTCSKIEIKFADNYGFVDEEDIKSLVESGYGIYIGEKIDSVGLSGIEAALNGKSAIEKTQAWVTMDGILHILVYQREPLVRFETHHGGYYIDRNLKTIPLHPRYTADVPIIEGRSFSDSLWMRGILNLRDIIIADGLWPGRFGRILSDEKGKISLVPSSGEELFILGKPSDLKDKFSKIELYYTKIAPLGKGYKTVNLSWKDQIICRQ